MGEVVGGALSIPDAYVLRPAEIAAGTIGIVNVADMAEQRVVRWKDARKWKRLSSEAGV